MPAVFDCLDAAFRQWYESGQAHSLNDLFEVAPLTPHSFLRRDLRSSDVAVRITHCGVCFSDLSAIRSATAQQLPLIPGHEFTGVVSAVGLAR